MRALKPKVKMLAFKIISYTGTSSGYEYRIIMFSDIEKKKYVFYTLLSYTYISLIANFQKIKSYTCNAAVHQVHPLI
jgi:hypothetical protein